MGAEIGVLNDDAVYLISEEDKYEPMKLIVHGDPGSRIFPGRKGIS